MKKAMVLASLLTIGLLVLAGCSDSKTDADSKATSPRGTLQGFVFDALTNSPVQNVTVALYASGRLTTTTDANGYWYFAGIQANEEVASLVYTLTAPDADGDGTADYMAMRGAAALDEDVGGTGNEQGYAQANSLTTVIDYMVQPVTVTGFVTDLATGEGINGATVVLDVAGQGAIPEANSNAGVDVAPQYTATTADHATSGAAGAYSITVPAVNLPAAALGAYADDYEYAVGADASGVNLQYVSSAIVDFRLNPLDNNMGLVLAQVDLGAGGQDIKILLDASGAVPGGPVPVVDLNGATQMTFTLIFDQPVDTSQFFGDTVQLQQGGAVVYPNMAPAFGNAYAVTLTADCDIQKLAVGTVYTLVANRAIMEDGGAVGINAATNLASFQVYDSTATAVNPTPALFVAAATDSTLAAHNGVYDYDSSQDLAGPLTTAQNYTNISAKVAKNKVTIGAVNTWGANIDITWPATPPFTDLTALTAINVYAREVTAAGDVVQHWTNVTPGGGNMTIVGENPMVVVSNLNLWWLVGANLRYGNQIDIAVTYVDAEGIQTAIDETKMLSLSDVQNPEVATIANTDYDTAAITFSESMNTAATTTVAVANSAIMSVNPTWVEDGAGNASLLLNATSAVTATVSQAGSDSITVGGLITFNAAGEADLFWVGQRLILSYANGFEEETVVAAVDTDGAAPTVTVGVPTGDIAGTVTVSISPDTDIRLPAAGGFVGAAAMNTLNIAGAYAVGDTIILRDTAAVDPEADIVATVLDVDSAGGTVTLSSTYDLTGYDTWIFEGDVFTVTAQDEAGNALHADADEITRGNLIE